MRVSVSIYQKLVSGHGLKVIFLYCKTVGFFFFYAYARKAQSAVSVILAVKRASLTSPEVREAKNDMQSIIFLDFRIFCLPLLQEKFA